MEGIEILRILAFSASNSSVSINRELVEYAASLADGHAIETLDIHDYEMPIYRHDREEADGIPQKAHDFLERIGAVDALIVSFAEHNGNFTAAWKNLFDWCSRVRPDVWQDKPMLLLATSPGQRGGRNVLDLATAAIPRFSGQVIGRMTVPSFNDAFDKDAGKLTDSDLDKELRGLVAKLTG